jgi:hypothetical protein
MSPIKTEAVNGIHRKPFHETRPENIPEKFRTAKEQNGLDHEKIHRRTPPISFYVITQIIYSYFGMQADYLHLALCEKDHQHYQYRHKQSDSFLRIASFCYDCPTCPQTIIEHAHAPGEDCTIRCDIRTVYRPGGQNITSCGHRCWSHIEPFPTFFSRQLIPEYPKDMALNPFYSNKEAFRHSKKLEKKNSQAAKKMVKTVEARLTAIYRSSPTIESQDLIRLFSD